ncbi:MAG: diheme cytochrome c [Nitrospinae bacterium]|nr:diheme cytochrome c [Nitrospinota bacterium]
MGGKGITAMIILAVCGGIFMLAGGLALAERDFNGRLERDGHEDDDGHGPFETRKNMRGAHDVARTTSGLYKRECGSCHFAYQPGLLPVESWRKVMDGLTDHFGEDAELPPEEAKAIMKYLADNASDKSEYKTSVRITKSLRGKEPLLRISQTPYFTHEHDEIPRKFYSPGTKVKSLSHCNRCHVQADEGSYNEHEVNIPGVGRWDD